MSRLFRGKIPFSYMPGNATVDHALMKPVTMHADNHI